MKEKLTLQDIVDLLAKKTSLTKKEADVFFREFFAIIIEDVFNNEPVKIKDFGTFKLTKVNSRESVDVNTGDKIEIPAHYKLSFIADKALKNLVNKPFSQFETTLLEDGISFDTIEEVSEETPEFSEEEDTASDDIDTSTEKEAEIASEEEFIGIDNIDKEEDSVEDGIESELSQTNNEQVQETEDEIVELEPDTETVSQPEESAINAENTPIEEHTEITHPEHQSIEPQTKQEENKPVEADSKPEEVKTGQDSVTKPEIKQEDKKQSENKQEKTSAPKTSPYSFVYTYTTPTTTNNDPKTISMVVPKENIIKKQSDDNQPKVENKPKESETTINKPSVIEPEKIVEDTAPKEPVIENKVEPKTEVSITEPEQTITEEPSAIIEDLKPTEEPKVIEKKEVIEQPIIEEKIIEISPIVDKSNASIDKEENKISEKNNIQNSVQPKEIETSDEDYDISDIDLEDLDDEDLLPLDNNKIKEKIDQLKEAIDALGVVEDDEFPLDIPNPAENRYRTESLRKERETRNSEAQNRAHSSTEERTPTTTPSPLNTNEDGQDEDFTYDFYQETFWTRLKRKLPLIIFLLIIIAFGSYNFLKLFNNQREVYTPIKRSLAESDTLPYIYDGIAPLKNDSIQKVTAGAISESTTQTNDTILESGRLANSFDKIISENLKIKVLKKATNQLLKNVAPNEAGSVFETVSPGATLRTIAQKHYGNNIFWGYIYLENKDIIRDIDNISVGTILKIPNLKKYNIAPNSPDAVEKAKAVEAQVYKLAYKEN